MCEQYIQSATTLLPRDRVWQLLTDIDNWVTCSNVYASLRWSGFPWQPGSCVLGQLKYPITLHFRHVLEEFRPPRLIRYIAHSTEAGFAISRTIRLEEHNGGTLITTAAYAVGIPVIDLPGGTMGFQKMLSERFFPDFANFCDAQAQKLVRHSPAGLATSKLLA